MFVVWDPLSRDLLDQYRGGFVDLSGIKISFGLERMVWVNDQLVQSLTLTFPDLTSLPLKGSAGAVSVQGPGPIAVTVDPVKVNVPPINVQVAPARASPQPVSGQPVSGVSGMANPPQVSSVNPSSTPSTPGQQAGAGSAGAGAAQVAASTVPTSPAQASVPSAAGASLSPGAVTVASVIQNGPGNVVTPEVLRNLGPGVLTVVQNTLNNQTIQGLTIINAQVSGLGSLIRNDVFSNLHLTLKGFGR